MTTNIELDHLIGQALSGVGIAREAALAMAHGAFPRDAVFDGADRIRDRFFGKAAHLCGIVNARSGACAADCRFCAQSAHAHTAAQRYPLLPVERLVADAKKAFHDGAHCFGIITSGPAASDAEVRSVAEAVRIIRNETRLDISVSLGMQGTDNLQILKDAGISRYHHNLETSRAFYPSVCSTHRWDQRRETLERVKALGIELCSGGIFGLGESWDDRIDLALTLRDLHVKSIPINFLNPVPGTALGTRTPLQPEEALLIVALYRYLLPDATLRICGGRPVTLGAHQQEVFHAGANALMTGDYLTTTGVAPEADHAMITAAGLAVADNGSHA